MSTTADLSIAVKYSLSKTALLFRIITNTFMQCGADLQFLSAFPAEVEYLYPPLTCEHLRAQIKTRADLDRAQSVSKASQGQARSDPTRTGEAHSLVCSSCLHADLRPTGKKVEIVLTKDDNGLEELGEETVHFTIVEVEPYN